MASSAARESTRTGTSIRTSIRISNNLLLLLHRHPAFNLEKDDDDNDDCDVEILGSAGLLLPPEESQDAAAANHCPPSNTTPTPPRSSQSSVASEPPASSSTMIPAVAIPTTLSQPCKTIRPRSASDREDLSLAENSLKRPWPGKTKKKRAHEKLRSKNKRRAERAERKSALQTPLHLPLPPPSHPQSSQLSQKHAESASALLHSTGLSLSQLPKSTTGFEGKRFAKEDSSTVEELKEEGYTVVKWDAKSTLLLVDRDDKVIVILGKSPQAVSWSNVHSDACNAFHQAKSSLRLSEKETKQGRGGFIVINIGYTIPAGGKVPANSEVKSYNQDAVDDLLSNAAVNHISAHANNLFRTWAPRLHEQYRQNTDTVFKRVPGLVRNFKNTIWASAAFNFGPQTVCCIHRDSKDLPYGLCAVTALGNFDYMKGGHLVLGEMKLALEFPPGSTILLPSGTVAHGNTSIAEGEERLSFTQYTSGSLFRWVELGFITVKEYKKELRIAAAKDPSLLEKEQARISERLHRGAEFFATLDELRCQPSLLY